ncbi:hypothetical protein F5141DRAFT_1059268 [Pisolithus sp. B1]|nr:hypothetical protein F5141DRAFT_1059268 [Pisolithus sp. B1]
MPPHSPWSPSSQQAFLAWWIPCPHPGCNHWFKTAPALKQHQSSVDNFMWSSDPNATIYHHLPAQPAPGITQDYHEKLTTLGILQELLMITTPPQVSDKNTDDWGPYGNRLWFETAEFLFQNAELLAGKVVQLSKLWGHSLQTDSGGILPLFTDHRELYQTINAMQVGDVQWDSFTLKILANTDFNGEFNYIPYRDFTGEE